MTTHRDSRPCDRRQTPRRGATSLVTIVGLLVAFVAATVSTSPAAPSLAATTPPPISSTGVSLMSTTPFASSVTVSAGSSNTCAIDDQGILYCWGSGTSVGDGTGDPRKIPTRVVAGGGMTNTGTVSAVTSGSSHNCAIEGGIVYCWGYNLNGQLGDNSTTARATPVKVNAAGGMANNGTVSAIAAGGDFTCAIEGGVLYCWGLAGKIGNGNLGSQTPLKVSVSASGMTNNGTVSAVSTGAAHSCAIEGTAAGNDAVLFCWGEGGSGQLGLGINIADTPAKVLANDGFLNAGTVSAVSAGASHTCALQGGTAYCWGGNGAGELGIGTTTNTTLAAHVQPTADIPNTAVTQIAAGNQFTCAIEAGVAGCWGSGDSGRLGSGSNTDVSTAVKVATGTEGFANAGNVLSLSITSNYASRACAVESTVSGNRLYCWGANFNGQLGVGDTRNTNVPKQVCTVCASSGSSSSSSSGSIPPPPPPTTTTAPTTTVPPTTTPPVGPRPVTAPTAGQQPSLITADDVETVEARPGEGRATIDGAPVAVTVTRIDSPAASVPADQRTSEQIAELRRAAADLVDAFNEGAPDPTTPLVTVTDTDTGAVLNGVLVDPEDATTPVPVPVEDVVIIDATTTKVLLAGADDQGRPEQVEGGVLEVVDGGYVAALAYGLPAGAPGEVVILSTPTLMGTFTTGADGSFAGQLALPADLEPGDHTVVLTAGGITTSLGVRVAATGETEIVDTTTTVPVAAPVELPATGPTRTGTHLALWAMVLTALGAALVMRRRHLV